MLIRLSEILAIILTVIVKIILSKGSNIHIHHACSHTKINLVAKGTSCVANVLCAVIIVAAVISIVAIITVIIIIVASAAAASLLRIRPLLFVLGRLLEQEFPKACYEHGLQEHFFPGLVCTHPRRSGLLHLERGQVLISLRQPEQTCLAEVAEILDHPVLHLITVLDPL